MTTDRTPDLRGLMSGFPTGVTVITALSPGGEPWGMTCTSLCSVSLDPPILLVCLRRGSPTLDAVLDSGSYAVNLLHAEARNTAELFASGDRDRFGRVAWEAGEGAAGPHLVASAHTVADCTVVHAHHVGDHAVVMGRATALTHLRGQQPLLYGMRRYGAWAEPAEESHLLYDFIS